MCYRFVQSYFVCFFFFSSRRRHTRLQGDWSSDVCSSDLYKGRGFETKIIKQFLGSPVYIGYKVGCQETKAKHKYYLKTPKDGISLADRPEELKGKCRKRARDEWIIPDERSHEPLIDDDLFNDVQQLVPAKPRGYAPRHACYWLRSVLYCGGCGKQMVGYPKDGKHYYCCVSYVRKYKNPGDPRIVQCARNSVEHAKVEEVVIKYLDGIGGKLVSIIE